MLEGNRSESWDLRTLERQRDELRRELRRWGNELTRLEMESEQAESYRQQTYRRLAGVMESIETLNEHPELEGTPVG